MNKLFGIILFLILFLVGGVFATSDINEPIVQEVEIGPTNELVPINLTAETPVNELVIETIPTKETTTPTGLFGLAQLASGSIFSLLALAFLFLVLAGLRIKRQ